MITLRFHHHQAKTSAISVVSSAVKLFASAACALNMTAFYAATRYSTTTTASTDTAHYAATVAEAIAKSA